MPRETVHWIVLNEIKKSSRLDVYPRAKQILHAHTAIAALGALVHDAPYYHRFGKSSFGELANQLHGSEGGDTFDTIRRLSAVVLQSNPTFRNRQWALVLGMITHMATDIAFHPMVFYFTGNYHHPETTERHKAQARHRMFEVYLDSWFRAVRGQGLPARIWHYQREIKDDISLIVELLGSALPFEQRGISESKELWRAAIMDLTRFQSLFLIDSLGAFFRFANKLFPATLSGIDALFSYKRRAAHPFFDRPLDFQDPITGERQQISVDQLLQEAVTKTFEWIAALEAVIDERPGAVLALEEIQGESLNFGGHQQTADEMRFASARGAPLPGLEITS